MICLALRWPEFVEECDFSIEGLRVLKEELVGLGGRRGVDFEAVGFGQDEVVALGGEEGEFEGVADGGGAVEGG